MHTLRAVPTAVLAATLLLAGCGSTPAAGPTPTATPPTVTAAELPGELQRLGPARLLLLGEQHDADAHQALEQATVAHLAGAGRLAALVLEMADRGQHTRGLPPDASETEVRARLSWNDEGWPWTRYGPVVMAAVRAGVVVLGGNQPRAEMRAAMADTSLDGRLAPEALARQQDLIRAGHCDLLPAHQLAPMARIQIARDRAMADAVAEAVASTVEGQVVMLVAGTEHVRRGLGVPAHLSAPLAASTRVVVMQAGAPGRPGDGEADRLWLTPATPPVDHCAELRQRWRR